MGNTRIDLTADERKKFEAMGGTYPERIKAIAGYISRFGDRIQIGRPYSPTRSTHIAYDDGDWEAIERWMAMYSNSKINHLAGRKATKKELLLHVADKLASPIVHRTTFRYGKPGSPYANETEDQRFYRLLIQRINRRLRHWTIKHRPPGLSPDELQKRDRKEQELRVHLAKAKREYKRLKSYPEL